ncbi:Zinc-finger domain of monoamine-oxidase A repressor R1 protein [Hirschfeldia incana]|nr:Zinc-finger domain of monoamine-oxidase A repressor R1 protein [Hirschfeldia incana]
MALDDVKASKRKSDPGVRVIGGRIYDSSNGKCCHQCRQKTMDIVASCKAMKKEKQCTINFCHKCLLNRYGEKAEEVGGLVDWRCPKCRGICNCSFCRKKRGQSPTGILTHKAKASGHSSVSQLLEVEGHEKFSYQKKKPKLENVSNGDVVAKDNSKGAGKIKKALNKIKSELPKAKLEDAFVEDVVSKENNKATGKIKKVLKQTKIPQAKLGNVSIEDVAKENNKGAGKIKKAVNKTKNGFTKAKPEDASVADVAKENNKAAGKIKKSKATNKVKEEEIQIEAKLPNGINFTNVSGIDIPSEEAGNVLQFLEFCSAFGKALDLKEGHAKSIVAEFFGSGRNSRRQQYCSVIPMMIQLMELISDDRDMSLSLSATDSTWFVSLGECLLQSGVLGDVFRPETFKSGVSEYKKMNAPTRLKLLNFLCDESLSTLKMRNVIEDKSKESETKEKEAKEKAAAAKEKEKQLRQKIQGDLIKAHMEKNGAPLSIEEHHKVLSQIKAEAKEAHGDMLKATSRKRQRCDAVRTDPILLNDDGLALWKLKCFEEEPKFLLQDLGTFGDLSPHEKWLAFKPEQKQEIEKYISSNRMKMMLAQKNANVETN